eukprot:gene1656-1845_t
MNNKVKLEKTNTKIYPYGSKTPLPLKGQFQGTIESKSRYTVTQIYVVEGAGRNLLSAKTAQDLNLIQIIHRISGEVTSSENECEGADSEKKEDTPKTTDDKIQAIIEKHKNVFTGEGKPKDEKIKLHIRDEVKPTKDTNEETVAENYVNFLIEHAIPIKMTLQEIREATKKDPTLLKVRENILSRKWNENEKDTKHYQKCAEEITINGEEDILLKGNRIIIPAALQTRATQLAHVGHQGVEKTKSLMREKVWFPNLDKAVKEISENFKITRNISYYKKVPAVDIHEESDDEYDNRENHPQEEQDVRYRRSGRQRGNIN